MATERQRRANRLNARRSTGPRTEAGKNRSRFNAVKHGLAALSPVLPHEDAAAFHDMRAALIAHYEPANIQELQLIDHIAHAQLRMERSRRFENGMFDLQLRHTKQENGRPPEPWDDDDTGIAACMCSPEFEKGYQVLFRYDSRAESQYFKSVNALHRMREARLRREARLCRRQAEAKRGRRTPAAPVMIPAGVDLDACRPPVEYPLVQPARPVENLPYSADTAEETSQLASFGSDVMHARSAPEGLTETPRGAAAEMGVTTKLSSEHGAGLQMLSELIQQKSLLYAHPDNAFARNTET